MLSWCWTSLVVLSIVFGILSGSMGNVSSGALRGAAEAVELCLKLAGPLCLWCGVGELLRRAGARDFLGRLLRPVLLRLFPGLRGNRDGLSALSANVGANLLGLGNAATPLGIEACRHLGDGSGIPTDGQCRLIVLNTASIQLLPTTVAALRASLGAKAPMDILPCVWLSSLCSVVLGLAVCRLLEGRHG